MHCQDCITVFFFCKIDRDECIFILIDAHGLTPLLPFPGKYSIDKEYRIDPVDSTSPSPLSGILGNLLIKITVNIIELCTEIHLKGIEYLWKRSNLQFNAF